MLKDIGDEDLITRSKEKSDEVLANEIGIAQRTLRKHLRDAYERSAKKDDQDVEGAIAHYSYRRMQKGGISRAQYEVIMRNNGVLCRVLCHKKANQRGQRVARARAARVARGKRKGAFRGCRDCSQEKP